MNIGKKKARRDCGADRESVSMVPAGCAALEKEKIGLTDYRQGKCTERNFRRLTVRDRADLLY